MSSTFKQLFLYSLIGAIGTIGHYVILIVLVEIFVIAPVTATTFGFIVGALINYFLNYYLTFRSQKSHSEALFKFTVVAVVGAGINSLIMYLGTEFGAMHYIVAQVIATGIVLLLTFTINKLWTFSNTDMSV